MIQVSLTATLTSKNEKKIAFSLKFGARRFFYAVLNILISYINLKNWSHFPLAKTLIIWYNTRTELEFKAYGFVGNVIFFGKSP